MSEHDFAVVGSQLVHRGAILALRVDEVRMPGGRIARREVVEHHGAVAVLALDAEDRVAVLRQYRHPVAARLLELPAGLLDEPGEVPVDAAARELVEEAGLAATDWSVLVDVATSPGFSDESVRVYLATGVTQVARPAGEDDEEADLTMAWVPFTELVEKCLAGEVVNSPTVSGVLALAAVRSGAAQARPADAPWPGRPHAFAERKATAG